MYRLYSAQLYSRLDDFEVSEVRRQPMTEVALRLKAMLSSSTGGSASSGSVGDSTAGVDSDVSNTTTTAALPTVTSVLLSLIEPPSLHSIQQALYTLHSYGMLTSAAEDSTLTEIGSLAAALPVDFMLGRFLACAGTVWMCFFVVCLEDVCVCVECYGRWSCTFTYPCVSPFSHTLSSVLLGVCREAVVVTAALGLTRGLFRTPSTLTQSDTDEFNR